jgi:hypothetical protein
MLNAWSFGRARPQPKHIRTYNGISDKQLTANLYLRTKMTLDATLPCPLPDARFCKTPLAQLKPQYGTDQAT